MIFNSTTVSSFITSHEVMVPDEDNADDLSYLHVARYVTILLASISLYLLLVLLVYDLQHGKRKLLDSNHLVSASAFFTLLNCINQLLELWSESNSIPCSAHRWFSYVSYGLGILSIYTYLWLRQRKLYTDYFLARTVSKTARAISLFTLFGIYVSNIALLVGSFVRQYGNKESPAGCIVTVANPLKVLPQTVGAIVATLFFRCLLLCLIVFPLVKGSNSNEIELDIKKMIVRLTIGAIICILSYLVFIILIILIFFHPLNYYLSNIAVLAVLVHILATVSTLVNWKQRLLSWYFCIPKRC